MIVVCPPALRRTSDNGKELFRYISRPEIKIQKIYKFKEFRIPLVADQIIAFKTVPAKCCMAEQSFCGSTSDFDKYCSKEHWELMDQEILLMYVSELKKEFGYSLDLSAVDYETRFELVVW